jgi:uncharacterized membrane protein YqjE
MIQNRQDTPSSGRSITEILQEIVNHVSEILRSEIRLAKTEVQQDVSQYVKALAYLVVAGVLACFAFGFVLLGAAFALQTAVPAWLAAVLVGALTGIVGAVIYSLGRNRMKILRLRPNRTLQTLEDNASWIKKQAG